MTRRKLSVSSFVAAGVLFGIISIAYPPSTTPRDQWLIAFALILLMLGAIGGGIGALFGHFWIGFIAGFVLPIIAFFAFGVGGMLC
jgi:hypothetical protein